MSDTPKRCGVSDSIRLILPAGARPWPRDRLTYRIDAYLEGLSPATQDDIHRAAFRSWADVTPLRFTQVPARQVADIILDAGRGRRAGFDGPSGVLAWMELPNGSGQPVHGIFDLDETWSNDPNLDIYLLAVSAHELGHALGLDHDADIGVALMDPMYNRRISRPQPNDVRRIQDYFGGPTNVPVDPTPVDPTPVDGVAGWITRLYQDVLARHPSDAELSAWLARAADRLAVARGILASDEHHKLVVDTWYKHYLRRAADAAGRANFVNALNNEMHPGTALAVLLASPEYFDRQAGTSVGLDPGAPATPAPSPPVGGFMRDIVAMIVGLLVSYLKSAFPFLGRFLEGQQDRIVDFILKRFGLELRLSQVDLDGLARDLTAEIGAPPTS